MTTSLVTGGAGFIGSHVVDHLLEMGHNVIVIDDMSGGNRDNLPKAPPTTFNFFEWSILDVAGVEYIFKHYQPDYVFHLAAYAAEGLSHYIRRYNYETNVIGSINLINAAVNYGVKRFVFVSSVAVYGLNAHGADEHQIPTPIDPYGIAKWTVEQDLMSAGRVFDLPFTIFRPGNVYGSRQNLNDGYRNCVGIFIRQCLKGEPLTIYGDGEQTRQFTYIDDVAPHVARCVDMPETVNHVYNLGADSLCTVNSVSRFVENALETYCERVHLPERFEARSVRVDHAKADEIFGTGPGRQLAVASGVHRMCQWAKTQTLREPKPFTQIEIEKNLPEHWRKLADATK